jgi:hypothetical protein
LADPGRMSAATICLTSPPFGVTNSFPRNRTQATLACPSNVLSARCRRVWHLRFHWHNERIRLEAELGSGRFRFGPLSVITKANGEALHLWSARDALVLKALALVVGPSLRLSPRCVHVNRCRHSQR